MTRAKERLYIFSKYFPNNFSSEFAKKGHLNSFLYQFSDTYPIKVGNPDIMHNTQVMTRDVFSIQHIKKHIFKCMINR